MICLRRFAALVFILGVPLTASAQPYLGKPSPGAGSFEVSGGVTWTRGYEAGDAGATLTRAGGSGTPPLTLFNVSSTVESAPGVVARLGVYVARRISVEGTFEYSRPILRAHLSDDFEQAADTDAPETITSYLAGGSLLYHFGDGRFVPFVSGGGGYLRQLHEENSELLSGTEIHGGGGVKYWFGSSGHRFGLRAGVQASARSKAVAFEQKRRILPSVSLGVAYLF